MGLGSDEIAGIQNFAVPADGTSPLDVINPPQLGTVNGSVFSGDGVTGIAGASVTFRNASLIYGRNAVITTDGIGNFVFNNVPVDSFSLQATYNNFQSFKSPVVIGAFAPGTTVATQNVVFTNDGVVRGTVRRDGFPIGGGFVQVFDSQFFNFFGTYNIAADGSYLVPILVPGNYQIRASVILCHRAERNCSASQAPCNRWPDDVGRYSHSAHRHDFWHGVYRRRRARGWNSGKFEWRLKVTVTV